MNRFLNALNRNNFDTPPVWLMRQAGRYHSHYQSMKRRYSFIELCKIPEAALETTLGPIRDFDFDAAILFSDLLFPLEALGMGLDYAPGPKLSWHLKSKEDLGRFQFEGALSKLQFQGEALRLIRAALPRSKGLIGFVGGPLTLFAYAVDGSHQGDHGGLAGTREGLKDGRWLGFSKLIVELVAQNMALQVRAGADTIAVMDTCAGEFDPTLYQREIVPVLSELLVRFHEICPGFPVVYYSKKTGPRHWEALHGLKIAGKGVDWRTPLAQVLTEWGADWAIQGNVDPEWMLLPWQELEPKLREVFESVSELPKANRKGWICGLGHGVLQKTPEENVRNFVRLEREIFG